MKMKERKILLLLMMLLSMSVHSHSIKYLAKDSILVESMLREAKGKGKKDIIYFARKFKGTPYVAHTLDLNKSESLVVNLRQLDCTTFVETIIALKRCAMKGQVRFSDYCQQLRQIRYAGGIVSYTKRKHYFGFWIEENQKQGIVTKVEPTPYDANTQMWHPFSAERKLNVNYMTQHYQSYAMLKNKPEWLPEIRKMEESLTGKVWRYIPVEKLRDSADKNSSLRKIIREGDILAILTNKKGLDISHLGIATWHQDGLHLLNASQVHHKVVDEPMTLYKYMTKHPSQLGIIVVRVNE